MGSHIPTTHGRTSVSSQSRSCAPGLREEEGAIDPNEEEEEEEEGRTHTTMKDMNTSYHTEATVASKLHDHLSSHRNTDGKSLRMFVVKG